MKSIFAAMIIVAAGIASAQSTAAQQKGDTCTNCTSERSLGQRPSGDDERARIAAHNEWPQRPQVAKPKPPPKYTVFNTNFLVNNESEKEIRAIKWTATLINRETQETIQTFPLETRKKIAPHKSIRLKERLVVPLKKLQGQIVSATQPIKDPTKIPVDEKYEIVEILYADKTVSKP